VIDHTHLFNSAEKGSCSHIYAMLLTQFIGLAISVNHGILETGIYQVALIRSLSKSLHFLFCESSVATAFDNIQYFTKASFLKAFLHTPKTNMRNVFQPFKIRSGYPSGI